MAFIEIAELKSAIYDYQIQEITEADDDIVLMAIAAATEEAKSYLRPNNKKEWQDGRLHYDVDLVFTASGSARSALLLEITKSLAVWYLCRLCNVDMLYDKIKDRYDRAITWLKTVNKGDVSLDLPLIPDTEEAVPANRQPYRSGGRAKFNHE